MGLFEKLKNTFFEEEYVEVDEEEVPKKVEVKKEKKKEEIKTEEVKNRTKVEEIEDEDIEELNQFVTKADEQIAEKTISDRELVNKNSKIEYFNDSDFVANDNDFYKPKEEKKETKKIYGGDYTSTLYGANIDKKVYNKPYSASNERGFQPTPIISPIYGVLDKNYRKDEVVDKKDRPSSYVSKKNADLDSVRRKAYGYNTLDDLPSYEDIVNGNDEEVEDYSKDEPLLHDMIGNNKPVVDRVSIADAEQYFEDLGLEYNVDYKDAVYEKANGRRTAIHNYDEDDDDSKTKEIIINNNIDKKEDESELLENNLFDLVDSIYEDGDE